jgi:heptose I phosphotransferase
MSLGAAGLLARRAELAGCIETRWVKRPTAQGLLGSQKMAMLIIQPEYRELLQAGGLADFDALFAAGDREHVDGHRGRGVSRLELCDTEGKPVVIYLKRWWGVRAGASWRDLFRLRWPMCPARREWANSRKLLAAGIAAAPPVAWGFSGGPAGPRALVAFLEVCGPSLAAWIETLASGPGAPPAALRRGVAQTVGSAVRWLHDAGFSMPDLYAKHLYLEDLETGQPRGVLIDTARLRRFTEGRAVSDLAALYVSTQLPQVHRADRWRVLKAYLGTRRLGQEARRLAARIEQAAARMPGRGMDPKRLPARRSPPPGVVPLGEEKMTLVDGGRLHINEAFRPVLEAAGLARLDSLMALTGGESYRDVPGRFTVRVELADPAGRRRPLYVKRYTAVPLRTRLRRMLGLNPPTSQGVKEAQSIARLANIGIATMRPVAFGEELSGRGWSERSCLVTEEIAGATQADVYCQARFAPPCPREGVAEKRRLIRGIADLARQLHRARLSHRDFYLCHILVRPIDGADPVLHLIDLQRLTHHRRGIGERWIVKDLAALLFSSWPSPATHIRSPIFTNTDRMRFARAYFHTPRLTGEHKRLLARVIAKARSIAGHEARRRTRKEAGA